MKKLISGSIIGLLLFILSGCNDKEFLKEQPSTFYTIDNIFTTPAQVNQALIAVYQHHRVMLANSGGDVTNFFWKSNGTDVIDISYSELGKSMNNFSVVGPNTAVYRDLFNSFYKLINKANLVLYAADQVTWPSATEKAYVIAQARFFRAFAHCNLAELWGAVPIATQVYDEPRYDFAREPRATVYQYCIDELRAIESELPVTTAEGGRIVRGAAQHFLCELYLALGIQLAAEGKAAESKTAYDNSITYANKVIDGGTYSLMNARFGTRKNETNVVINILKNGVDTPSGKVDTIQFTANYFWDLFQNGNVNYQEGNKECIWAIQCDYAAAKAEDGYALLAYPRQYGSDIRDASAGNILGVLEDVGGRGIKSQIPTFYWRETIWADKWGTDMRNTDICLRRRFKGNVPGKPYYLKDVPWSLLYDTKEHTTMNFPISCKITTDKFEGLADGQNRSNIFRDEYAIRLPETILLRAEAKQRNGDKSGAAADVNLLRNRAKCTYLVTAADMDDEFNTILDERARELTYEEHRWNTLLRMGGTIAVDRLKKYMMYDELKPSLTKDFNLLPIPQSILDVNRGNKWEQNPGW